MYLSLLPEDILEYLFTYLKLRDVSSVFTALRTNPSYRLLRTLAEENELPYTHSLASLIVFKEEIDMNRRIKHCAKLNDLESFKRLYDGRELIYTCFTKSKKRLTWLYRPDLVDYYLSLQTRLKDDSLFAAAVHNKLYNWVRRIAQRKVSFRDVCFRQLTEEDLYQLSDNVPLLLQKDILSYAIKKDYSSVITKCVKNGVEI